MELQVVIDYSPPSGNFPSSLSLGAWFSVCANYMVPTPGLTGWLLPAMAPAAHWALMGHNAAGCPQRANVRYSHPDQTHRASAWQSLWRGGSKMMTLLTVSVRFLPKSANTGETQPETIKKHATYSLSKYYWLTQFHLPPDVNYDSSAREEKVWPAVLGVK